MLFLKDKQESDKAARQRAFLCAQQVSLEGKLEVQS